MASNLQKRALPVAQYECGHFVVARKLGFTAGLPQLTLYMEGHRGEAEIELQMEIRAFQVFFQTATPSSYRNRTGRTV
jgi:hypothetical protein